MATSNEKFIKRALSKMNVVPFGKYRGQHIDRVPVDYLHWLLTGKPLIGWLKWAACRLTGTDIETYNRQAGIYKETQPNDTK